MKHPERCSDYLENIIEAIDRSTDYVHDMDFTAFKQDTRTQDAVVRNIEIIGEAANTLHQAAPDYTKSHQDIPWSYIRGMRNVISHEYWRVDIETVWRTVQNDLPELRRQMEDLLRQQERT